MVLIYISLMANVEHNFMCLFALFVVSVKCLFMSFAQFLFGLLFFFLLLSIETYLYSLGTSPLSDMKFPKFSPSL